MGDAVLLIGSVGAIALGLYVMRAVRKSREQQRVAREAMERWRQECVAQVQDEPLRTALNAPGAGAQEILASIGRRMIESGIRNGNPAELIVGAALAQPVAAIKPIGTVVSVPEKGMAWVKLGSDSIAKEEPTVNAPAIDPKEWN